MNIKITAVPQGEAPLWVREAWIGLELPLLVPGLIHTKGIGVLAASSLIRRMAYRLGLMQPVQMQGYIVNSAVAITLLQNHDERAAAWWQTNLPEFLNPGSSFVFDAPACTLQAAND